jgi:hypothetical protein
MINSGSGSFVSSNSSNNDYSDSYLAVKLYQQPLLHAYYDIQDYDLPIFRKHTIDLTLLPWDITYQYIILHIDGNNSIKQIISEINIDNIIIKKCIVLLLFHQQIIISDIFRYTNIYKLNVLQAIDYFNNKNKMIELCYNCALIVSDDDDDDSNDDYKNVNHDNNSYNNRGEGGNNSNEGVVDHNNDENIHRTPTIRQIILFLLKLQQNKSIKQIIIDSFIDITKLPDKPMTTYHYKFSNNNSDRNNDNIITQNTNYNIDNDYHHHKDDIDNNYENNTSYGSNSKHGSYYDSYMQTHSNVSNSGNRNSSNYFEYDRDEDYTWSMKDIFNYDDNNSSSLDLRNIDLPKLIGYCKNEGMMMMMIIPSLQE